MPINKNALIRYMALDRCLSHHARRFYIDDLTAECCKALSRVNGVEGSKGTAGVSRRQVLNDLNNMEAIYGVTIRRTTDGRRKYFSYAPGSLTLRDSPLRQEEIDRVGEALQILSRFDGLPHLDWLESLRQRIYTVSRLGPHTEHVVSFGHNPDLMGIVQWFLPLFDAIVARQVIRLTYHPFDKDKREARVSPYHLKQYNDRWFLIGKQPDYIELSTFAVDRIEALETEGEEGYEPLPADFRFSDYFADVVGVSVSADEQVMDVVLRVTPEAIGYVLTKPLHESQTARPRLQADGRWQVALKVKDNYELRSLLRSFGAQVEVISPASLRQVMAEEARRTADLYG